MKRTLAIGDIHGGFRALVQLLDRIHLSIEDKLIFLGDYVDGWSQSAQVINYLVDLEENVECIFIKGNHDIWCEEWLRSGKVNDVWYAHGGKETIDSYAEFSEAEKAVHHDFFDRMKYYHIDQQNNLFIHAGFASVDGPQYEIPVFNTAWDRTLWEMAISTDDKIKKGSASFPERFQLFNEIFIGHTPTIYYDEDLPMHRFNLWNIDTGAAFIGKLSGIDINSKQIWQSETLQTLYPNEKGRNK